MFKKRKLGTNVSLKTLNSFKNFLIVMKPFNNILLSLVQKVSFQFFNTLRSINLLVKFTLSRTCLFSLNKKMKWLLFKLLSKENKTKPLSPVLVFSTFSRTINRYTHEKISKVSVYLLNKNIFYSQTPEAALCSLWHRGEETKTTFFVSQGVVRPILNRSVVIQETRFYIDVDLGGMN